MRHNPEQRASRAGRIEVLPDALIDQIAAGEVVERPASVVKELVENALDAGATHVRVEVRAGGSSWIAVADDGCGMSPEDARRALQRHATSKLHSAEDLRNIATFGFRGEALPAIASVSRLRLRSRAADAAEAFELRAEAGRIDAGRAAAGPVGTRVEVAALFANVPARRKFLKTPTTEWGHVADWLARVALARPDVHFDVQRDDRLASTWPAVRDPLDRIAAVLSERDAAALVPVRSELAGAQLHGFSSDPSHHRSSAAGIHLFVNGRPVRDRLLRHALISVYRDVLPRGRFPSAVLFLELPPDGVDVNVHPAKWEVRFRDPQSVHQLVARALADALGARSWLGASGATPAAVRDRAARTEPTAHAPSDWIFAREAPEAPRAGEPEGRAPAPERLRFAALPLIGQLRASYLLIEGPRGLLLVDQHAAHERILYERLRAGWQSGGVERQPLLLTETVDLDPVSLSALGGAASWLASLGFELEPFGDDAVAVRAVPALLAGRDPAGLVQSLADELRGARELGASPTPSARALDAADRLFATLACHSARRAGDRLDAAEQRALLEGLDAIPWAPTCPHGRPVAVPIDADEIERRFARR